MVSSSEVKEVLEIITSIDPESRGASPQDIATKLGWSIEKTLERLNEGLANGLLEQHNSLFKLTEKGLEEILAHRAQYVHDNLIHKSRLTTLIERLRGKSSKDMKEHLQSTHRLDSEASNIIQHNLQALKGQVEQLTPLTELKRGESGEVVFVVAGRGLLARLAAMGLTPKVKVKVVRSAPLRGPIEISLRDISIILGYGVASKIYVRRISDVK
ncbi:MAG: FeoA domain-containing protein [Nitrososphaerales archaeon]